MHLNSNAKYILKNNRIWFCLLTLVLFYSCAKDYEKTPLGQQIPLDLAFDPRDSAGKYAINFLTQVYGSTFTSGHNRVAGDYLDAASDDAISSFTGVSGVENLAKGAYNATVSNSDDVWSKSYGAIRDATIFILNVDRVPIIEKLPDGRPARSAYKSEARFLRAWTYFELIKRYGGVPITGNVVYQLTDDIEIPRQSFDDCVKYVVSELDSIKDSLRTQEVVNSANYGRITKGAALALKSRILLYSASQLFNGGNVQDGNVLTGYTNYDKNRWKLAADAAKVVMDMGTYALMPNYKDIFTTQAQPIAANKESILWCQIGNGTAVETTNGPVGYASAGGTGRTSPSEGLVESFPMISGLDIADPNSNYNTDDPYINRDPRLTATIFYNGAQWLNRAVQTFSGGADRPGGAIQQTKTGYYMRKFMGAFETVQGSAVYSNTIHDWIYIRYAEILLNYVEALNEYQGPSDEIYNTLFALRKRAGILSGTNNDYGLQKNMSQDQMRIAIRNERRIEMAFEEQRYWDIRRWKIAAQVYAQPVQGMDIQQSGSGQLYYNKISVFNPNFDASKMYLYPIPYDEIVKNNNMKQNPGW